MEFLTLATSQADHFPFWRKMIDLVATASTQWRQQSIITRFCLASCGVGLILTFIGLGLLLFSLTRSVARADSTKKSESVGGEYDLEAQSSVTADSTNSSLINSDSTQAFVDVGGAVANPGIYRIQSGDRVSQALESAGGPLETADQQYLAQKLNLAQVVRDGQKIYLPFQGEKIESLSTDLPDISQIQSVDLLSSGESEEANTVSINSASQAELEELEGVGVKTAEKIIQNRPYQKLEELTAKKVISVALFNKLKELMRL